MNGGRHYGLFICWRVIIFLESECWGKQVLGKYFLIFDSIIKNKLENIFQCLVMSCKISWKITY
jgi:hypothetical protein